MDEHEQNDRNKLMTATDGGIQNFPETTDLIISTVGENPKVIVRISAFTLQQLLVKAP